MSVVSSPALRRVAQLVGTSAVAALVMTSFGVGTAAAAPVESGALDCAPLQIEDGRIAGFNVPDGVMQKDNNNPTAAETAAMEALFQERLAALDFDPSKVDIREPLEINVYVHLLREDLTVDGGNVPRTWVRAQIKVLNHAFRGHGEAAPGARSPFKFMLGGPLLENGVNRVTNANWYNHSIDDDEVPMKTATRIGTAEDLNLWSVSPNQPAGLLGYATFPSSYESQPMLDGVVILDQSMPGGSAVPYDLGDTGTHEVGHWLGLYHTFQEGCDAPGDRVDDTPYEAQPFFGPCSEGPRDSCGSDPGDDPIENFMDYSEDTCLDRFSIGQRDRMIDQWFAFRDGVTQ